MAKYCKWNGEKWKVINIRKRKHGKPGWVRLGTLDGKFIFDGHFKEVEEKEVEFLEEKKPKYRSETTEVYIKFKEIPEDMKYEFDGPGHRFKVTKFELFEGPNKGYTNYYGALPSGNSWSLDNRDANFQIVPDAFDNIEEVDAKDVTIIEVGGNCIK